MPSRRTRASSDGALLQALTLALAERNSVPSALRTVLRRVCEATGWVVGEAWSPSPAREAVEWRAAWHRPSRRLGRFVAASRGWRFKPGQGLPGRVWTRARPAWILDVRRDRNFPRAASARLAGLRAGFAIPVLAGREVVAVIAFYVREARREDRRLVALVSAVAAQLGAVFRRRLTEDALSASRATLADLEDQRQALSRELHDGVGQLLSSAVFRLRALEERLEGDARSAAAGARGAVEEAVGEIRRLVRNLGPRVLEELGLPAAVRGLVRDVCESTGAQAQLEERRFPRRLPPGLRLGLFRVLQEALSNVARHARASRVRVTLEGSSRALRATVRDNGCGFDLRRRTPPESFGLRSLGARAGLLGGTLVVRTRPGRGTEVDLRVPWRAP